MEVELIWVVEFLTGLVVLVIGAYVQVMRGLIHSNRDKIERLEGRFIDIATTLASLGAKMDALDARTRQLVQNTIELNQEINKAIRRDDHG